MKEIIYGIDSCGSTLRELIEVRKETLNKILPSLKAKLDTFDTDTTAQFQQTNLELNKKASINYVDALLMDIAKGGPKGMFNSIAALKAKYPDATGADGTWLVLDSSFGAVAHSFFWDRVNKIWKDLGLYQSTGIAKYSITNEKYAPKSLTPDKIVGVGVGNNMLEGTSYTTGQIILNGSVIPSATLDHSDFIPIIPNMVYTVELGFDTPYPDGGAI